MGKTITFTGDFLRMKAIENDIEQSVLDALAQEALKDAFHQIQGNFNQAITKLKSNGKTVNWDKHGDVKSTLLTAPKIKEMKGGGYRVYVGFDISQSLVSQYLIYGTPRIKPSKTAVNAMYSKKTNQEISRIFEAHFDEFLSQYLT